MMKIYMIVMLLLGQSIWAQESSGKSQIQSQGQQEQSQQIPQQEPQQETQEIVYDSWHFGLGLSYGLVSKLRFDHIVVTGAPGNFTADLDYENTVALEIEARKMSPMSWGFMGGLSIDGERKFTGGTISGMGTSISLTSGGDTSKIQTTVVYGNAVYRWNQFYLPFGFNISAVKFTPANSSSMSASGGLGGQLGVGFYINKNFVIEAYSRAVAVKMSSSTTDYGSGFMSNLMLTGKYIF